MSNKYGKNFFYCGKNDEAKVRLFCFPYAGGGASIYARWKGYFDNDFLQVMPVQLPGRESRHKEVDYENSIIAMAKEAAEAINEYGDTFFALFGHSMGGIFVYEVAKELVNKYNNPPKALFISGTPAPSLVSKNIDLTNGLSEELFQQLLRRYNGMDPKMLENSDFYECYVPVIKRDFIAVGEYRVKEKQKLNIPLSILYGIEDKDMTQAAVESWREYVTMKPSVEVMEGGHFYIREKAAQVCQYIENKLKNIIEEK